MSEGIAWQNIEYNDNGGCIQLISKNSTGLFDLLDNDGKYVNFAWNISAALISDIERFDGYVQGVKEIKANDT